MTILARILMVCSFVPGIKAQTGKAEDIPKAFQKIYSEYLKLTGARMHFDRAEPAVKEGNAAAFEAWLTHARLDLCCRKQLALVAPLLPPATTGPAAAAPPAPAVGLGRA